MKQLAVCLALFLASLCVFGQTGAVQGFATLGGVSALTSGSKSSNTLQGVIPSATITVYLHGTTTKATIYKDSSSTPLANPFTANTKTATNPGGWIFWASTSQGLDIMGSGGICPNCYAAPTPLAVAVYPSTAITVVTGVLSFNGRSGVVTLEDTDVDAVGDITNDTSGNADTASALAALPTHCSSGDYFPGILANGDSSGCTALPFQSLTTVGSGGPSTLAAGVLNVPNYSVIAGITALTGDVTATGPGSAAASVVKVNGASVPASKTIVGTNSGGQIVDASSATLANDTTGNADTATDLASYPALCTGDEFSQGLSSGSNNCAVPSITAYYQTVQANGSDEIQEPKLNLKDGTNTTVTCADNSGVSTECRVDASGGGGGGVLLKTASYPAVSGDSGKNIVFNAASAPTLTLPASPPSATWYIDTQDNGATAETVYPNGLTLDGSTASLVLQPGMGTRIFSDGTNYYTQRGGILTPNVAAAPLIAQSASVYDCVGGVGGTCGAITYANDISPGSALVVELYHSNGGSTTTPTDVQGDTFVIQNTTNLAASFDFYQYVACNAVGGPTTITESNATFNYIAAYEVAGAAATSCVDKKGFGSQVVGGTGSPLSTGSITTTTGNDFLLVTGALRGGAGGLLTEANGYTNIITSGYIDVALYYDTWYGVQASTGAVSDTISQNLGTGPSGFYAGILAIKPLAAAQPFTIGSIPVAGPTGALQPLAAGPNTYCWVSNGPLTVPSYQQCVIGKSLTGSGAAIPTGPNSSTNGDIVTYTGTSGQQQDSGTLLSSLAPKASPIFSGTPDASGATQFKLPTGASYTSAANGEVGYDSSAKNWHLWLNGADYILAPIASGFVSGNCGQPTNTAGVWTIADSGGPCSGAAGAHPSVTFSVATGSANTPAAPYVVAPITGTVSDCYFTTLTSDSGTNLVFNVKFNGTNILSGTNATVTAGTTAGTISTFALTSGTISITQGQLWELDISTGTTSWTGAVQCF